MYKIRDWEKAIKQRKDIQFSEIYLKDGLVKTVIGTILVPYRQVRGQVLYRWRKVRWNQYGICLDAKGCESATLYTYNMHFSYSALPTQ